VTAYLIFDDNIFKKLIFPVKWVTCHHGTVGSQVADGDKGDQCVRPWLSDWFPYLKSIPRAWLTDRPDDGGSKHL
jgi:hypothetical protein